MWPYLETKEIKYGIYSVENPYSNEIQDLSRFSSKERIIDFSIYNKVTLESNLKEKPRIKKTNPVELVDTGKQQSTSSIVNRSWNVQDRSIESPKRAFGQDSDKARNYQSNDLRNNANISRFRDRSRDRESYRERDRDRESYRHRDREPYREHYKDRGRDRDRNPASSSTNLREYRIPRFKSNQDIYKSRNSHKPADRPPPSSNLIQLTNNQSSKSSSNLVQLTNQNSKTSRPATDPRTSFRNEKERSQKNTSTATVSSLGMCYDVRSSLQSVNSNAFTTKIINYESDQQSTSALNLQQNNPQQNNPQQNNPQQNSSQQNSPQQNSSQQNSPQSNGSQQNSPQSSGPLSNTPIPIPKKPNALDPRLNRNRNLSSKNESTTNATSTPTDVSKANNVPKVTKTPKVHKEPVQVEVTSSTSDIPSDNLNQRRVPSISDYLRLEKELEMELEKDSGLNRTSLYNLLKSNSSASIDLPFKKSKTENVNLFNCLKSSKSNNSIKVPELIKDRSHLKELGDLGLDVDDERSDSSDINSEPKERIKFKTERNFD